MRFASTAGAISAAIVIAGAFTDIAAQQVPRTIPASVFESVCPAATVRITGTRVPMTQGTCRVLGSDSLVLMSQGTQQRIALIAVDTIWVREGNTGRGALIGAGVGAAVFGIATVGALCHSADGCYSRAVLLGVAVGGGIGAILGAGVGALAPSWLRRYP